MDTVRPPGVSFEEWEVRCRRVQGELNPPTEKRRRRKPENPSGKEMEETKEANRANQRRGVDKSRTATKPANRGMGTTSHSLVSAA